MRRVCQALCAPSGRTAPAALDAFGKADGNVDRNDRWPQGMVENVAELSGATFAPRRAVLPAS